MENFGRNVKFGVIGVGARGRSLVHNLLRMDDVEITAICDPNEKQIEACKELIKSADRPDVEVYDTYEELIDQADIEGVIIASDWITQVEISIYAMKAGKHVGCEVGAVASIEECWDLVKTAEESDVTCMFLENCNYGRDEMAVLNMARQGMFGEIVHCQAGYQHDLRELMMKTQRNYRINHYIQRDGDNYPTHGLGPVAKLLDINRGNQFVSLTAMSSKARGLAAWATENLGEDHEFAQTDYAQGDIVTTIIKCANGETIVLTLDTSLPRPYSRAGRVQGTKGIWMEDNNSIHIEGKSPAHGWESFDEYREKYEHPLWKEFIDGGVKGSHGGMDHLVLRAFVESIVKEIEPPIDVYDMAAWRAVSVLTEQSILQGGHPVPFPDFTNGKWIDRDPTPTSKYSLTDIDYFEKE